MSKQSNLSDPRRQRLVADYILGGRSSPSTPRPPARIAFPGQPLVEDGTRSSDTASHSPYYALSHAPSQVPSHQSPDASPDAPRDAHSETNPDTPSVPTPPLTTGSNPAADFPPASPELVNLPLETSPEPFYPHLVGMDANGDELQQAHRELQQDVRNLLVLPPINIPREQRVQTPRQMRCQLMEHQKVCLSWLMRQEEDRNKRGGLLADGMGLGKTIQALALIVARPSSDGARKTTLIVAPLALLRQWQSEIETKIKPQYQLKTIVFHGGIKGTTSVDEVLDHDIVLCTYGKLTAEYKARFELNKLKGVAILHPQSLFYRVILDEAHNIKNKSTKASLAAAAIQSEYRLCMTGTPFMNRAAEIYPLIRFLRIAPYDRWERFSEEIDRPIQKWDGDRGAAALRKLQAVIRSITIRRTKESRLDGQPIIRLPPRREEDAHTQFDPDQAAFYHALECQQRLKFNKYLKAGTVLKNYIYVLVLLLRLRQACDHPHLIKNHGTPEGTSLGADEMLALALKLKPDVVARIKAQEQFECPICDAVPENAVIISPCGHSICPECFALGMSVRETQDDGGRQMEMKCPEPGCRVLVTGTNVVMHNFFVDAHAEGSRPASVQISDNQEQESEGEDYGFYANDVEEIRKRTDSMVITDYGGRPFQNDFSFEEDYEEGGFPDDEFPFDELDNVTEVQEVLMNENMEDTSDCSPEHGAEPEISPWRGNSGGLFMTQSPEQSMIQNPNPGLEFMDLDNDDEQGSANAMGELQNNEQTAQLVHNSGDIFPEAEALEVRHLASANVKQPHPTPSTHASASMTLKGTAADPIDLDDDNLDEIIALGSMASNNYEDGAIKDEDQVMDEDIVLSYDGAGSPGPATKRYREQLQRKRRQAAEAEAHDNDRAVSMVPKRDWELSYNANRVNKRPRVSYNLNRPGQKPESSVVTPLGTYRSSNQESREDLSDVKYEPFSSRASVVTSTTRDHPIIIDDDNDDENEPAAPQSAGPGRPFTLRRQRSNIDPDEPLETIENCCNKNKGKGKAVSRRTKSNQNYLSLGQLRNDAFRNAEAMHRYRRRLRKEWVSSAKIDKIMSLLADIRRHQPREKTLIFSLWTSFLDLLEVPIQDVGFGYTRYDGSMRPDTRDAAVKNFMENPDVEVMLVSLTAGNAGLNLTAASQVIISEPFWNPFTEEQAIDRAHRIGQMRRVTVHRVLIAGTVEDRILALQSKKKALVNAALSEEGASYTGRLSIEELQSLFGV